VQEPYDRSGSIEDTPAFEVTSPQSETILSYPTQNSIIYSLLYFAHMEHSSQIKRLEKEIQKMSEVGSHVTQGAKGLRDSTFTRFPIIFSLLTTFGLVATLYGFEKVIDNISFLSNHPEILLIVGLATLAGTGTLYKKLS